MKRNYPVMENCKLFTDIHGSDIKSLLNCLPAKYKHYKKNSFIFTAGDKMDCVGIMLVGAVHILREDFWGKRKIVARIEPGGLFGVAFACAGVEKLPVSIMAVENSEVMFVNINRIITPCPSVCSFHASLIKNLTLLLAENNIALIQKLEYVTQPSTRKKLLSYLSEQARLAGKSSFNIPFNREELADFLSVERSGLSAELSKMKDAGLLLYKKNHFELLKNDLDI